MEKQPKPRKYGIPYVSLFEYDPTFISNVLSYNISWEDIPRNFRRIRTFLSFIAQIKYKELKCYSFLPSEFASEYYIFIDIDIGKTLRNCREIICIFLESMLIYVMNEFSDSGGHFHGT